ncbi:MAG TPA: hemerythrin domain-containing protein [Actinomycetota bacterium]|nr:hemerythrin domain-containing protein [Actinomycetota bacterium]
MDAVQLLEDDHKTVEDLFGRYEEAGDEAYQEKRHLRDRIVKELTVHATIEEEIFYPATREARGETEQMVEEAYQEHAKAKQALTELERMEPEDPRFEQLMRSLIADVRHHVEEEEGEMFPKVQQALPKDRLQSLAEEMKEAKKTAPQRPSEAA